MNVHITRLTLCSLLILACIVLPVSAQVYSVVVDSYKVTPPVLMPGEKGTVTVTIRSTAAGSQTSTVSYPESGFTASSATTTVFVPYIDSVILTEEEIRVLGGNGQFEGYVGPEQIIPLTFLIEAPDQSGLYFPDVLIRVRGGQSVKYPVPVNVNTQISVMRVPSLILQKDFPVMVKPGTTEMGLISIRNHGQVRADNIHLVLQTGGLPVAPAGSSVFLIDHLDPGEVGAVNASLVLDRRAESQLVEVPLMVTYRLLDGTIGSQNESISLDIRGEAELGIAALETAPARIMQGGSVDLTIRIENTGTGNAKSVSAQVDLPFSGIKEAFLGTIKPGNDAPAVFTIDAGRPGTYHYQVEVTYTDDWGTKTFSRNLEMTVYRNYGPWITLVAMLILAGGGYMAYRWWKRRREAS
ncbi:MAG TPA: S-layer protein [Methanoregulaceae archaeon]|nr:S-layer protein [Methanoregulaceae archaeon]